MKNIYSVCLLFIAIMVATGLAVNADEAFEAPEDGLEINFIKGHSDRDLSVEFNHSSHEGFDCAECHHKIKQLKEGEQPRSCATCHTKFDVDATKGYKPYFKAMHMIKKNKRRSCVACHTEEFGNDPDMTGCTASGCHSDGIH